MLMHRAFIFTGYSVPLLMDWVDPEHKNYMIWIAVAHLPRLCAKTGSALAVVVLVTRPLWS